MCKQVRSKSTNSNLCLLQKYSGTVWEDSFNTTWYSASSISKYVLLVTASRHPVTWQEFGTCDGPRTFFACREQTKVSVVVADLWSVRWSFCPKWNHRRHETTTAGQQGRYSPMGSGLYGHGCVLSLQLFAPDIHAEGMSLQDLMSCFTYWARESISRNIHLSPFPQLRDLIFCLCFQLWQWVNFKASALLSQKTFGTMIKNVLFCLFCPLKE